MKTDEVCDRSLDPFGFAAVILDFFHNNQEREQFPIPPISIIKEVLPCP